MRRPTIADLAEAAGVSVATVDRVLNGRYRVREETARRVLEAAHKIGFYGANVIRARVLAEQPEYHLGFILQKERHAFYQTFARQIEEAVGAVPNKRLRATIRFVQSAAPAELADLIRSMKGKVQAVAATGLDHHDATAAVAELRAVGVPTFSLLSDFAQGVRESYIGTNNLRVGRSAAWLMSKMACRPGKIVIFIGGHRYHGHALRETGFRSYFREFAPDFELLDSIVNIETRQLTCEATLGLLARHDDVVGIYVAGGGMEGAVAALREVRQPDDVACIVNELTPESTQGLLDRFVSIVMATPLPTLCSDLVAMMVHAIEHGMAEYPGQRFLPIELWTPESL
ncbi:LacI family DNA-binding transcriptional regulator [Methylobacterium nodulans]|uniref:Transcriptional regulator, LacI family n=1 Tax=Methylobacterium nodulans (strain LMG 21967 / CNCM I-2342 / ORS 2060) TaxID=460265 RepID=B8IXL2_METNO|nr:LacI family DNA-binding transcriptional regulator [Methylobacterium nodulans]ACL62844.1 transcriptional regulator, LacI family [Methylobacterium nodulans ORS 2060]